MNLFRSTETLSTSRQFEGRKDFMKANEAPAVHLNRVGTGYEANVKSKKTLKRP